MQSNTFNLKCFYQIPLTWWKTYRGSSTYEFSTETIGGSTVLENKNIRWSLRNVYSQLCQAYCSRDMFFAWEIGKEFHSLLSMFYCFLNEVVNLLPKLMAKKPAATKELLVFQKNKALKISAYSNYHWNKNKLKTSVLNIYFR